MREGGGGNDQVVRPDDFTPLRQQRPRTTVLAGHRKVERQNLQLRQQRGEESLA